MAGFESIFDKWLELMKAQTTLTAELAAELFAAVQGSARSGGGVLRFNVSATLAGDSGPQNNPTIFLPGVATGNIAVPAGFHNGTGGTILGSRLIKAEVTPNKWQFQLRNIAPDGPVVGTKYAGTVLNTANMDVLATVIIEVVA
jgi:hypothetical protein